MAEAAAHDSFDSDILSFAHDPLGFVMYAWPWGEAGTVLAGKDGPEPWQRDVLKSIGTGLATSGDAMRIAIASGHGVGKSALVSWIVIWALATLRDTRGVVTANTATQLATKTWPELTKWLRLSLCGGWFDCHATSISSSEPRQARTWRLDAVPWNLANPEAFAGLHNQGKRILVAFDEASAIPDLIWETIEGALTDKDTEIVWLATGNPTRNTGRFRECFGRFRHRWIGRQVDGRQVSLTDKDEIARWAGDYGDDSDFFRVRVKGQFPRAGSLQFIDGERVAEAMKRPAVRFLRQPLVMGVDVARFGDDRSVIFFRRGLDGRSIPMLKFRGLDTMQLAGKIADAAQKYGADAVYIDEGGLGAGVVDRCRQLAVRGLIGVQFGGKADRLTFDEGFPQCANKRAEMWASVREWLKTGAIADDPEMEADLTGVEYAYNVRDEIQLETKERMKKRGLASPDIGDALALTFAYPPADLADERSFDWRHELYGGEAAAVSRDYDPFAEQREDYDPHADL